MKNKLLYSLLILQIIFFACWIGFNEHILRSTASKIIILETVPVDPRDFLSGNYFILNYSFSRFNAKVQEKNFDEKKKTVYLVLKNDGEYFKEEYITTSKPAVSGDEIFIRGKRNSKWSKIADYGIGRYYINEKRIEPKRTDKVDVEVAVNRYGVARVSKVFVNGEEFRQ